jgi:hypothetical protein
MFTELEPKTKKQKKLWDVNRRHVYSVSVASFIKSLYYNKLAENGFLLSTLREAEKGDLHRPLSLVSPSSLLSSDLVGNGKILNLPDEKIMLVCYGSPVTESDLITLQHAQNGRRSWNVNGLYRNILYGNSIYIYPDGTYRNRLLMQPAFSSSSIMGLNRTLPLEYLPETSPPPIAATGATYEDAHSISDISRRFDMQLSVYPQEKVHLHTDKPYYISGERIWFRAHVVDAASHTPALSVYCVYAELFDARDSLVCRVKTGVENNIFSGYIPIPADVSEGDYTIRAYASTMRDLDEDYFFLKNIRIGSHLTPIIQAQANFEFISNRRIGADIRFPAPSPASPVSPISVSINNGKPMKLKCTNGVSGVNFNLSPSEKQRAMLLDATYDRHSFQKYFRIPLPEDDFDVSFYPEGGAALYGCVGRIAFKAIQRDGTEMDVSGVVYDFRNGKEITRFKTDICGMGQFTMMPEHGERYYAVCTNGNGKSKRFDLPVAKEFGYALTTNWLHDRLIVKVVQPESLKTGDTLFLAVHTRGMVQDVQILKNISEPVTFHRDFFPSGVTHLLLLNKDMTPVSERLAFTFNDDQAKVSSSMDRDVYPARSPVEYTLNITDESGYPLQGNISVSVTDSHEVVTDTTANILTSLLLASDLRGNISNPAFYFQKNNRQAAYALDLLMLTQGWRRYDVERIAGNNPVYPDSLLEFGQLISGTVTSKISSNFAPFETGRLAFSARSEQPEKNADVSMISLKGGYFENTVTDANGRFYLHGGDAPDSTWFIIQTSPASGNRKFELMLDKVSYPERVIPVVHAEPPEPDIFTKYANKAEQQYVDEHGTRTVHIREVTISAPRKPVQRSDLYTPDYFVTEDELEKRPPVSMSSLLNRLPGVTAKQTSDGLEVSITRFGDSCQVMFLVDNILTDNIDNLDAGDVAQVDVIRDPAKLVIWGNRAPCGIISIFTKKGAAPAPKTVKKAPRNIQYIMPLGFQKPAEFYAPKYDTPALNTKPDLRTTIHWEPNLTTDEEGKASFRFYTADTPSTYSVVIEGVTDDGKIVYKRDKIVVGVK